MKKKELGPWHPEEIKPVHVGIYEVDEGDDDGRAFSYWDGKKWGLVAWEMLSGGTPAKAIKEAYRLFEERGRRSRMFGWRGLAKRH